MADTFKITPLDEAEFLKYQNALKPVVVPLEQSPAWGEFNNQIKGRKYLGSFKYDDTDGKFIALATAILYKDRGRDWIWIKHGPLFASVPNTIIIKKLCTTLKKQFSGIEGADPVFIRLSMSGKTNPLVLPFEHTMYDETVIIDLTKSEDEIFMAMSKNGRQEIRKAEKCGVEATEITDDTAEYFKANCYPILQETAQRDKFNIHPLSVYAQMLGYLKESSLYVALVDGHVEAWAIITEYNGVALYYYGASSSKARETSAAYLLQWEIIKTLKNSGIESYDLMGIAGKHFPALKNVTGFKTKFSKNIVQVPVTYDLPLRPLKYHALSLAIKTKRKLRYNR